MSSSVGRWLGWLGILAGVVGFVWRPLSMGALALILGLIGLSSDQKRLNGLAIAVGLVVLLYAYFKR